MKYFLIFLLIWIGSATAEDKIHLIKQENLPSNVGVYRDLTVNLTHPIEIHAVTLNETYQARLYLQEAIKQTDAQSISAITQKEKANLGINGGFYTAKFEPAGLFIQKAQPLYPLMEDPLLTSCLKIDKNGKVFLKNFYKNCADGFYAMQTGPVLIEEGSISPQVQALENKFPALKQFFKPHYRTIVANTADGHLLILTTTPATLQEIAQFLQNSPQALGVARVALAVDLDGGPSTGISLQLLEFFTPIPEKKPVKTVLLISKT